MEFYKANIGWKMEHTGDVKRNEAPEIPLEAMREIVVNAFSHGKYDSSTDFWDILPLSTGYKRPCKKGQF